MDYDAVIFDKDGVLLDSMSNGFKWADEMRIKMARDMGKEIDMNDSRMIVRASTVEKLEEAVEATGLEAETIGRIEEEIAKRKIEKMKNGDIQLFTDTKAVLEKLEKMQIPRSVASNAPEQTTRFTVKNFGIENYFETVRSPPLDDIHEFVRLKKPSPHMLEDAIETMDASNPVMVGDSDDDIKAAKKAGVDSIFVNTNGGTDLNPTHKVQRLKSVLDIV
jgi:HAD superfamily hydrolase (TIGR01549 family)